MSKAHPPASPPHGWLKRHATEIAQVCAVLALFWGVMVWIILSGRAYLDADECTLLIMGWHIQRGELPLYFYGQHYMGCVEAYLYAMWDLVFRSPSVLTAKLFAAALSTVYLLTCYGLARRFTTRSMALFTLLMLALPAQMLGIWFLKIRGYLPWLIAGNVVVFVLLELLERLDGKRDWGRLRSPEMTLAMLGAALGLAWWINPLSIYHIVLVLVMAACNPALRRLFFAGAAASPAGAVAHGTAVIAAFVLIVRSLLPARTHPLMLVMFDHREAILTAGAILLVGFITWGWRQGRGRRKFAWHPGLFCVAFLAGSAPQLIGIWSSADLNLKQGLAPPGMFLEHLAQTPVFILPNLMNLTRIEDLFEIIEGWGIFPDAMAAAIILLYLVMGYALLRRGNFEYRALRISGLLVLVALLLYNAQAGIEIHEHRYLLCLFFPLALGMAYLFERLEQFRRGAGWMLLLLLLSAHSYSLYRMRVHEVTRPDAMLVPERELVDYLERHSLRYVYVYGRSQLAERISYFSREVVMSIQADNVFCRQESYLEQFRAQDAFTFVMADWIAPWNDPMPRADAVMDDLIIYNRLTVELIERSALLIPNEGWPERGAMNSGGSIPQGQQADLVEQEP